jgi:hypothetical protein
MEAFYGVLRIVHIFAGTLGLLTLVVPFAAKKGGTVHKKIGAIFALAMAATAITGLVIASLWISIPLEVKPPSPSLGPDAIVERARSLRTMGAFLGFVGLLTLNALVQGIGALGRKTRPEGSLHPMRMILPLLVFAGGLLLLIGGAGRGDVRFIVFGVLGTLIGINDVRFAVRPLPTRMAWWYQHMRGMSTAAIAGVTAFMVFNANRLIGIPQNVRFIPWILPTLVGSPLIAISIRRYMKKFRETDGRGDRRVSSPAAPAVE